MNTPPDNSSKPKPPPPGQRPPAVRAPMPVIRAPVPEDLDAGPTPFELPAQEGDLSVPAPGDDITGPGEVAPESLPLVMVPAPSARSSGRLPAVIAPPPPPNLTPSRAPPVIAPPPPVGPSGSRPNIAPVISAPATGSRPNLPQVPASRPNAPPIIAGPGATAAANQPRVPPTIAGPGAMAPPARQTRAPMITAAPPPASGTPAAPPATGAEQSVLDTLLPPTGGVEGLSAEQVAQLGTLAAGLDQRDYFQLLGLPPTAAPAAIKKAFYSLSRVYHPDRFFHLTDELAKDDINAIYKRVTEAYYVLRDDRKRKKYVGDIGSPERAAKLRFTDASEVEAKQMVKKEAEEQIGVHPKGRQFWGEAEKCLSRDDIDGAARNLKMALTYEPTNPRYKEELAKVQVRLDAKWKASGDKFKIR